MTRIRLPTAFAVIREQGSDGPRFQFLMAEETGEFYEDYPVYRILDADWGSQMTSVEYRTTTPPNWDQTIHKFYYEGYHDGLRMWNYWSLPYYFPRNGTQMPILEFQYKSWLPSASFQMPIRNARAITQHLHQINRERMDQIMRMNGGPMSLTPIRPPPLPSSASPPIVVRRSSRARRTSPTTRRLDYRDLAPPPVDIPQISEDELLMEDTMPQSLTELIQLEQEQEQDDSLPQAFRVHTERSEPVQLRALPLPQHVGRLLIQSARTSTDSCPITAQLYSECEHLSVTSCFHVFNAESLQTWRSDGHSTCPTCRTEIVNVITD